MSGFGVDSESGSEFEFEVYPDVYERVSLSSVSKCAGELSKGGFNMTPALELKLSG